MRKVLCYQTKLIIVSADVILQRYEVEERINHMQLNDEI